MATSGKKSKKKQWKNVPTETLVDMTPARKTNWADESEELYENTREIKPVALPTAPRSARATEVDESKVPTMPPYVVHVGNIPYEIVEDELAEFFKHLNVKEVNFMDKKGHGHVEFEDRESLLGALSMPNTILRGRPLIIDLQSRNDRGGFRDRRGGRDDRGPRDMGSGGPDRTAGDWRSGPRSIDLEERSNNFDRGGYGGRREGFGGGAGGSFGRYENRDDRNFDRDRSDRYGGGRDDRGGGGGRDFDRDRDKGFGYRRNDEDRSGGGSAGGWRDGDRTTTFRDRGGFDGDRGGFDRDGGGFGRDRGGYGRDRDRGGFDRDQNRDRERDNYRDRERDNYRERDRGGMSRRADDLPPASKEPTKTRPKLKLLPKGSAPPPSEKGSSTTATSIFGGAKPVDTAAREREVESRLTRGDDLSEARDTRSGPGSTSGSSQKDFEIERRIEPAPPPKENAWSRNKPSGTIVNNGRTTPEENQSTPEENSDGAKSWPKSGVEKGSRPEGKKSNDAPKSSGGAPAARAGGPQPAVKSPGAKSGTENPDRGKKDDRPPAKHKEGKKDYDDISKMPKMAETKIPNFADSNKFSQLGDSEEPTD